MEKFNCKSCGNCCSNFGSLGTLPLFNDEKERYEKLAKDLGVNIEFVHENVLMDEETGTMFSANWGMNTSPCPFLNSVNECIIYKDRALVCKAFPISKIPSNNQALNLGDFIHCENFDNKKFFESENYLSDIYGEESVSSREKIQRRQRETSERIFGLISLGKIDLIKIENFYALDVIPVERFFEVIGL